MQSIMQTEKECYICQDRLGLEMHHCIHGNANRKQSEKYGLKVWLCYEHHRGNAGVHNDRRLDLVLIQDAQMKFEEEHTREEFRAIFGKSWL